MYAATVRDPGNIRQAPSVNSDTVRALTIGEKLYIHNIDDVRGIGETYAPQGWVGVVDDPIAPKARGWVSLAKLVNPEIWIPRMAAMTGNPAGDGMFGGGGATGNF